MLSSSDTVPQLRVALPQDGAAGAFAQASSCLAMPLLGLPHWVLPIHPSQLLITDVQLTVAIESYYTLGRFLASSLSDRPYIPIRQEPCLISLSDTTL